MKRPIQRSPGATDGSAGVAPRPAAVNAVTWLRLLVRQLRTDPGRGSSGEAGLLLEFDVDGTQCLLIERPSSRTERELSPREREIARMVAKGYPDKAIAAELGISRWTVSTHLRRTYVKLGVHSRAAMVAALAGDRLPWPSSR